MHDPLEEQYAERLPLLEELRGGLERETIEALSGVPHIDRVSFRVKGIRSFLAKASDATNVPSYKDPLVEVEDQVAGRILVLFRRDLEIVREKLTATTFNTVEHVQRRPKRDAEFGYESDHLICLVPPYLKPEAWDSHDDLPTTFELQIRTLFMHAYAAPQHDLAYKAAGQLPQEVRRELAWIAASAWGADQAYERVYEWNVSDAPSGGRSGSIRQVKRADLL